MLIPQVSLLTSNFFMEQAEQKLSKKTSFAIAVAGQIALLVLLVLYKLATFSSGAEVLLKLQPIDPRDMLRGDYVTVRYSISRIRNYTSERIYVGDTVYVPLTKGGYEGDGRFWSSYGGVTKMLPPQANGQIYMQGIVKDMNPMSGFEPGTSMLQKNQPPVSQDAELTIQYGIEDYYIPEGAGHQSELNNGTAYARVAVDADGKAIIKQLYLNDKPWPK